MARELVPLPTDDQVVDAVRAIVRRNTMYERAFIEPRASAADVAAYLGLNGARRAGNGAVKGSWSGYMAPALRIAPRLRALAKRGVLTAAWVSNERVRGRYYYDVVGEEWWRR